MKNQYIQTISDKDPAAIAREAATADAGLILCFYGASYDHEALFRELKATGIPFAGSMDTGRLLDDKYLLEEDSAVAITLSKEILEGVTVYCHDMRSRLSYDAIRVTAKEMFTAALKKLNIDPANPDVERTVAINLLYGLQSANPVLEGQAATSLFFQSVGGSSGGKLDFKKAPVICSQGFGALAVTVIVKLKENFKFASDLTTSFEKEDAHLEVTKLAGPRHILELNGKPAAQAYAEAIGKSSDNLQPEDFALYTLGLEPGDGERLITSIMKGDGSGGLLTYNDAREGTTFTLYKAVSQVDDRQGKFARLTDSEVVGLISFDCVLCYLARGAHDEVQSVADMYSRALPDIPKAGFGTFSENYCGANVNQTETFLAILKS